MPYARTYSAIMRLWHFTSVCNVVIDAHTWHWCYGNSKSAPAWLRLDATVGSLSAGVDLAFQEMLAAQVNPSGYQLTHKGKMFSIENPSWTFWEHNYDKNNTTGPGWKHHDAATHGCQRTHAPKHEGWTVGSIRTSVEGYGNEGRVMGYNSGRDSYLLARWAMTIDGLWWITGNKEEETHRIQAWRLGTMWSATTTLQAPINAVIIEQSRSQQSNLLLTIVTEQNLRNY